MRIFPSPYKKKKEKNYESDYKTLKQYKKVILLTSTYTES